MPVAPSRPQDIAGLSPDFRNAVTKWLAAGQGAFRIMNGGGCRSTQRQAELRIINGCPDVYSSPASSCRVPTAIPGTSRHERCEAVDIEGDKRRAKQLAPMFGLTDIPREDWHFQFIGGTQSSGTAGTPIGAAAAAGGAGIAAAAAGQIIADDDCLIRLPSVDVPGPFNFNGTCLLTRSQGRAVLGAFLLVSGTIVIFGGVALLVGKSLTVPKLPSLRPTGPPSP